MFWKVAANKKRPKDVKTFQVFKQGPAQNHIEFILNKNRAYFLERPSGNARTWDYALHKGNQSFYVVEEGPIYKIRRNQAEANIEFYFDHNDLAFTMEWAGKGNVGGLAASPRQHIFFYKGEKYEWSDSSHTTGIDLICKNLQTQQTVAYFRSVMTPANKIGKFEVQPNIEEALEEVLVATFIGYREWSIRRQMCMFGDEWFNQSVTV